MGVPQNYWAQKRRFACRWEILFHLAHEARRYGDLRRAIGNVSDEMLIQQRKELQAGGIVERRDFKEIPPKIEYSLTAFGQTFAETLKPLCAWGTEHMTEVEKLVSRRGARGADHEDTGATIGGRRRHGVLRPRRRPGLWHIRAIPAGWVRH